MLSNRLKSTLALLLTLAGVSPAFGQTYTISPSPFLTALDNSGNIINNACIWTYEAGTSTPVDTFQTSSGTLNANPIRSDSAGRFTAYLQPGQSYKFVYESACTPPAHGTTLRTADNIAAVPVSGLNVDVTGTAGESLSAGDVVYLSDGSGALTAGQWYKADADLTYASNSSAAIGIATAAISSAASGSIRIAGRVTGLSGLTVGARHFVSATAGALTATAPANARFVGVADSTTTLVVAPNPRGQYFPSGSVTAPAVAVGDIDVGLYSSGANALELTTNGVKALGIDSTQFIDSPTQPRASASNSTTQSISNGTETAVTFDTEATDVGAMHSTVSNTSRFTVPTGGDGWYLMMAAGGFAANATGARNAMWKKNGSTQLGGGSGHFGTSAGNTNVNAIAMAELVAGDYVEFFVSQNSGGALNIGSASDDKDRSRAQIVKIW